MEMLLNPIWAAVIWGIALAVFIVVELATMNLVTIWFAVGSLAALLCSLFTRNFFTQLVIFVVVSAVALAVTKPFMDKACRMKPAAPVELDRNLGRTASVIQPVAPRNPGRVRLDGVDWAAVSNAPLAEGDRCTVVAVGATTLTVEPLHAADIHTV